MSQRFAVLALVLFAAACGGKESMASKSADAYREAQAKGVQVGGDGHHAHGAATSMTSSSTGDDHAAHETTTSAMDHGAHAAMDHTAHAAATTATDHARHATAADAHAGHEAPTRAAQHDQHAGMQHGSTQESADPHVQHRQPATPQADPHAGHTMTAATPHTAHSPAPTVAPPSNIDVRRVDPASTLRPDAFDAPAPVSVSEAAKAKGGGHEGHGKDH